MAAFIVCDEGNRMASISMRLFGKQRTVMAMFKDEQDALDVAMEVERISGVLHTVRAIGDEFEADDMSFVGRGGEL